MAEEDKGTEKPPKPATLEYQILQELKNIHDTLKAILKVLERNL